MDNAVSHRLETSSLVTKGRASEKYGQSSVTHESTANCHSGPFSDLYFPSKRTSKSSVFNLRWVVCQFQDTNRFINVDSSKRQVSMQLTLRLLYNDKSQAEFRCPQFWGGALRVWRKGNGSRFSFVRGFLGNWNLGPLLRELLSCELDSTIPVAGLCSEGDNPWCH
jgi:hypothetical protein